MNIQYKCFAFFYFLEFCDGSDKDRRLTSSEKRSLGYTCCHDDLCNNGIIQTTSYISKQQQPQKLQKWSTSVLYPQRPQKVHKRLKQLLWQTTKSHISTSKQNGITSDYVYFVHTVLTRCISYARLKISCRILYRFTSTPIFHIPQSSVLYFPFQIGIYIQFSLIVCNCILIFSLLPPIFTSLEISV